MKILCTICSRKNSKGIKNKALQLINGKPLISYTIRQAIKSKLFDKIIVSTDSKKIQKISKKFGATIFFKRPAYLATDNVSKLLVIKHALEEAEKYFNVSYDYCVDLDLTSPLRSIYDIKNAVKTFKKSNKLNLFSVCEAKKNPYFNLIEKKKNKINLVKKSKKKYMSRQKTPKVYEMNASIYIFRKKFFKTKMNLFSKNTMIFEMNRNKSIDIDDYFDLFLIKKLLKNDKKLFK